MHQFCVKQSENWSKVLIPLWSISLSTLPSAAHPLRAKSHKQMPPGWLGMGPTKCVKPMGSISLQESTEVIAANWGMKAYQQAVVLRWDQRVAYMGWRGFQLGACLDAVWMSNRRGGCLGGGGWFLGRGSMKPHEGWRASKNLAKLYSFSIKGWIGWIKKEKKGVGHPHMPQLEKCKLAQCPDMWGMPQFKAQSARHPSEMCAKLWRRVGIDVRHV